jgi:hypothetical protein
MGRDVRASDACIIDGRMSAGSSVWSARSFLPGFLLAIASAAFAAPQDAAPPVHQHQAGAAAVELFPARDASGTGWLPDETPMHGTMRDWRGWSFMLHGGMFAQFLYEPGDRHRTGGFSTHQFSSPNWGMLVARRQIGGARAGFRVMASLDPWTIPGCGYLSFLATGETCEEDTIHDRQHPHDLFMELAADYDRPLRGAWRWQIYGGLSGEPALGPAAFPHRVSAALNPIAPIGHHWLDASHISFGVVTAGVYDRRWKLEMSAFNGREPDENRGGIDLAPLDSVSGRVSFAPNPRLSLQVSAGHLEEAELEFAPQPRIDVDRATASLTYHRPVGSSGLWASTVAFGLNSSREAIPGGLFDAVTQAWLFESSATMGDAHTVFGRVEIVEKPAHDLHAHEFPTSVFTVGKLQIGYVRQLRPWKGVVPGIGAMASVSLVPEDLASRYGGRAAPGYGVFLSLRPGRHVMR